MSAEEGASLLEGQVGEGPPAPTRWNFVAGLVHGWFLAGGLAFADPYTVLPVFVRHITHADWVVGLASPLLRAGGFLPQIWVARLAETLHRQKPVLILVMGVRFLCWLAIAAVTALVVPVHPTAGLVLILLFLFTFSFAGGVGAVPFQELYARLFPPTLRGRFLAWRQIGGGLLAIVAGGVVKMVLDRKDAFPLGYALLFLLSALTMAVGFVALASVREPQAPPRNNTPEPWPAFLVRLRTILRGDAIFRRLLATELGLRTLHLCLPFLVLDLKARLDLGVGFVATSLAASMAGQLIANLLWGSLSDRLGNRFVIVAVNVLAVGLAGLALAAWAPFAAVTVFFLSGAVLAGNQIGYLNYLLEAAPLAERPAYIALRGTIIVPTLFLGVPGGLLAGVVGYRLPEAFALVGAAASVLLALRLPCLRRNVSSRDPDDTRPR